uniref:Very-long-chain (3R)-3-hydroxyacyl-CoA dehydratase n=1 Tax=Timema monikensis TaxID=170555 RepID=A0A7R9HPZ0_9NEOP|nr:unnamed protein product [Timema monikensis]
MNNMKADRVPVVSYSVQEMYSLDSIEGTYEAVGGPMKFCQLMQFLEVMHPMFGYTKGGFVVPLLQVLGRSIILFCMIDAEPRMHTKPVIFYLFLIWSIVEFVRNIPYFEETQRFTVSLPNSWNFAFHCPTAMRIYLLILFFPGCRPLLQGVTLPINCTAGDKEIQSLSLSQVY